MKEVGSLIRVVGVISDTHGLLRPEAVAILSGADHIVHAGDIGSADIVRKLRDIAPVTAVRGNNDTGPWAETLPASKVIDINGRRLFVLHDRADIDMDLAAARIAVVIAGHSHKPSVVEKDGVVFLNPGSAGPRRFSLPITVATLRVAVDSVHAEIHELDKKS